MIIYGTGEKKRQLNLNSRLTCPNCGKRSVVVYLFHKYAHLFWIPTVPIGKRTVTACEECNTAYQNQSIPESLQLEISDYRSNLRPPLYLFTGLLIILLGISYLIYLSNQPKTYKYPSGNKQARGKMVNSEMDGKWTFWYENGNISAIQYYHKGVEDSTWIWYNEDGSIEKTGSYENGRSHGLWTFFYPGGQKMAEEIYVENRRQGKATYWYENGVISSEGNYKRDLCDGLWKIWFESGAKKEEGMLLKDKRTGEWISYYENGKEEALTLYTDTLVYFMEFWDSAGIQIIKNGNGEFNSYYTNGQMESQGKLRNGISIGVWKYWYPDGKLKETGQFKNANYYLDNSWDDNGNLLVVNGFGYQLNKLENGVIASEGNFVKGLKEGIWKLRNVNDTIIQLMSYSLGKINGKTSYFFDSGELSSEGEFINDIQTGKWTWYFKNGTKESQVNFENGLKQGEQCFWNESGKLVKSEFYEKGNLVNEVLN